VAVLLMAAAELLVAAWARRQLRWGCELSASLTVGVVEAELAGSSGR